MNKLVKILTIDKNFLFKGSHEDFIEKLTKSKGFNFQKLSKREYKFRPDVSLGTMRLSGGFGFGIYLNVFLRDQGSDQMRINFKTNIRPEHYFLLFILLVCILGIIFSGESKLIILYFLGMSLICHSWFQYIYRLQENYLMDKLIKRFRLSNIKK